MTTQYRLPTPNPADFGPLVVGTWRRTADGSEASVEGWDSRHVRLRRGDDELRRVSRMSFLATHELIERRRK